jgi:disulfide oxidoreductase YuzD
MNNKKETAVEWLVEKLNLKYGNDDFIIAFINEIEQAKKLEKQQIIEAYHINPLETKWGNIGIDYYNETYGGQNNEQ